MQDSRGDLRHARISRGIAKLRLKLAPFLFLQYFISHIPGHTENSRWLAPVVEKDVCVCLQVNCRAGWHYHPEAIGADFASLRHGIAHGIEHYRNIIRMGHGPDGIWRFL